MPDLMQILVVCLMAVGIALVSRAIFKMKQLEERIEHIDSHMDEMLNSIYRKHAFHKAVRLR